MLTKSKDTRRPRFNSQRRRVRFAYGLIQSFIWVFVLRLVKIKVEGRENIPHNGALVVAVNHLSTFDITPVVYAIRRDIAFLAAVEVFKYPIVGPILRWLGHIPVERGTSRAASAADAGLALLKAGGAIGIFPEGKCSRNPDVLQPAKNGLAWMATNTSAAVLPMGIWGTQVVRPLGTRGLWINPFQRVTVRIGQPIQPPALTGDTETDRAVRRAFTDHVMDAIAVLSGQARETAAL